MTRISIHTSPSARKVYGFDNAAAALRDAGLYVAIVEGPISDAPESDFWFVDADDIDDQGPAMAALPKTTTERLVLMQPGRARAFKMLEELGAAAAVEALGTEWAKPIVGNFAGRREIVQTLGGRLRRGLILFGESEHYSVWENHDIPTLAGHVARYLEAFGPRNAH